MCKGLEGRRGRVQGPAGIFSFSCELRAVEQEAGLERLFFFWLRWVFIAARGLSLVALSGGYSSLWCVGFSLRWLLLLWSMGSR